MRLFSLLIAVVLACACWTGSLSAQSPVTEAISGATPGATPAAITGAISVDGLVESTAGGFKFPDGTVQSGAAASDGTPVHLFGKCLVADNADTAVGLIFTVPTGKRLEVDFVSLAAVNLGFSEGLLPLIHMGSMNSSFYFEEMVGGNHYPALGASLIQTTSKRVHMDAAAGQNVSCEVWTTSSSGTNRELQVSIAGHLLDAAP